MDIFVQPWEYALWAASVVLEWALVMTLIRKRHKRAFPAFSGFACYSAISDSILLPMSLSLSLRIYFWAYWMAQLFSLALLFCVVHEVFEIVTQRADWVTRSTRRRLIRIATAAAVILIGTVIISHNPSPYGLMQFLVSFQRALSLAIFSFMLVLIAFTRHFQLPWNTREAGIALGVVVAFAFQTLWPTVEAFLIGTASSEIYRQLVPILHAVALAIWIRAFRVPDLGPGIESEPPKKFEVIEGGKRKVERQVIMGFANGTD